MNKLIFVVFWVSEHSSADKSDFLKERYTQWVSSRQKASRQNPDSFKSFQFTSTLSPLPIGLLDSLKNVQATYLEHRIFPDASWKRLAICLINRALFWKYEEFCPENILYSETLSRFTQEISRVPCSPGLAWRMSPCKGRAVCGPLGMVGVINDLGAG